MRGNKENCHSYYNSEDHFQETVQTIQPALRQKKTIQCSIQVNMDLETPILLDSLEKKKNKRKQYRKRKRQKCLESERLAKIQLECIVLKILRHETLYEKEKARIQNCMCNLQVSDRFHEFLDQVIKLHVRNLQRQISDYTQQIIQERVFDGKNSQEFYRLMVRKIYQKYLSLRICSVEVEKVIHCYMKMTSNDFNGEKESYQYLDHSIFNYLIESDETMRSMLKACDKKVDARSDERVSLDKLLDIVSYYEYVQFGDCDGEEDDEEECLPQTEQLAEDSTTVSEEQINDKYHISRNSCKKKNKKKKNKMLEQEMKSSFQDVIARIQRLVIDDQQRTSCAISQQWLEQVSHLICTCGINAEQGINK